MLTNFVINIVSKSIIKNLTKVRIFYAVYDKERMWIWITTFQSGYYFVKKDTVPFNVGMKSCWYQVSGRNIKLLGILPIMGKPLSNGAAHEAALAEADLRTEQ